jgi:peptide/nickel transport system ATP-binding protein
MPDQSPLLSVEDLKVHFPVRAGVFQRRSGTVRAVDGVSFSIRRGETLSLVGESGCGKSTTGLALMGLVKPTGGLIRFAGQEIRSFRRPALKDYRRRMQIVFQAPFSALNPRHRVREAIRVALDIHHVGTRREREARVADLMDRVGLRPDQAESFPHQFSGGQRQRIGIARALALKPDIIVCDEPVSALDVSVQAQILNLLSDLKRDLGVAYLFISHDLGVVGHISDRIAVMYLGKIVEIADKAPLFAAPTHPYTEMLLASAPALDPRRRHRFSARNDDMPSAIDRPPGCPFHTRCPLATEVCTAAEPPLSPRPDGRLVACHHR